MALTFDGKLYTWGQNLLFFESCPILFQFDEEIKSVSYTDQCNEDFKISGISSAQQCNEDFKISGISSGGSYNIIITVKSKIYMQGKYDNTPLELKFD
jgi:alpha-tubulin suppressor-like RCC1 family protein